MPGRKILESTVWSLSRRGNNRAISRENPCERESRRLNRLFAAALCGVADELVSGHAQDVADGQTVLGIEAAVSGARRAAR